MGGKKTKREMRLWSMGYRVLKKVKFYFLCKKEKRKKRELSLDKGKKKTERRRRSEYVE